MSHPPEKPSIFGDKLAAAGFKLPAAAPSVAPPAAANANRAPPHRFRDAKRYRWGIVTIRGEAYDLTHLNPFRVPVPMGAGEAELVARVRFGAHVFSEKWSDNYLPDLMVMDGATPRCFCPNRVSLTAHLPGIIRDQIGQRAKFDPDNKLVFMGNPPGVFYPYAVFFNAEKAPSNCDFQVDIMVVSAHERAATRGHKSMPFPELAKLIAAGQAVPWPIRK